MTEHQKLHLKLNIVKQFKKLHYSLIEVYEIFDDLKRDISNLAIERELKKMKFKME